MVKEEETEKVAQDDKYAAFSILLHIQDAQDPPKMYLTRIGGPHTRKLILTRFKENKAICEHSPLDREL